MTSARDIDHQETRHVVVIGAGFSGAAVAANLLRAGAHVTLVERGERFGPGLAYGRAAGANVMNVRAARLSLYADEPAHFVHWLERRQSGDQAQSFAKRAQYGAYVRDTLNAAAARRWPSRLRRVRDEATACRAEGAGWAVTLASGRLLHARAVVIAIGHPPPAIPAPFAVGDMIDPWDRAAQRKLPRKGDVLLVGTGLTMVDVALGLAESRRKGVIYALSRRGQLPHAHAAPHIPITLPRLPAAMSEAVHAFRAEAKHSDWRVLLDALRAETPAMWRALSPEAQRRFLRHLRPWWDSHRHRVAPDIAAQLAALIEKGRLHILSGEIIQAARENGVWRLQHRGRGSVVRHRMETVGVINCAGADFRAARWADPLVRQLLDEGLARAPANGLGLEVDADDRLLDAAGVAQPGLFALGPLALGSHWETIAVPELRARAASIARALA